MTIIAVLFSNGETVLEDSLFYSTFYQVPVKSQNKKGSEDVLVNKTEMICIPGRLALHSEYCRQPWSSLDRFGKTHMGRPSRLCLRWHFPKESKFKPKHLRIKVALWIVNRVIRYKSGPSRENQIDGHLDYRSTSGVSSSLQETTLSRKSLFLSF